MEDNRVEYDAERIKQILGCAKYYIDKLGLSSLDAKALDVIYLCQSIAQLQRDLEASEGRVEQLQSERDRLEWQLSALTADRERIVAQHAALQQRCKGLDELVAVAESALEGAGEVERLQQRCKPIEELLAKHPAPWIDYNDETITDSSGELVDTYDIRVAINAFAAPAPESASAGEAAG